MVLLEEICVTYKTPIPTIQVAPMVCVAWLKEETDMPVVVATDREGTVTEIEATDGLSLMRILKDDGGLDIAALCGGGCACATCHVHVAGDWLDRLPAMEAAEQEMLCEVEDRQPGSRLACQIRFSAVLNGLRLTLAPE